MSSDTSSATNSVIQFSEEKVPVDVLAASLSSRSSASPVDKELSPSLEKQIDLPEQRGSNGTLTQLRHAFFTVYRQMFAAIFCINAIAFIAFVIESKGYPTLSNVKNATSANILACVMMRQENVVNFVYEVACSVPLSTPFFIRRRLAKVYHYGGVHSGCGVAAVVWFALYTGLTTRDFVSNPRSGLPVANTVTCYFLIMMYLFMLMGAFPRFRVRFHDYFEITHRFSSWTSFVILWVQTFLLAEEKAIEKEINIGLALASNPGFWFLLISTFFILISWGRLRRRDVVAEVLSSHATRLHFTYKDMPPYYGLKVSDRPLTEWHAFATIPEPNGKGFSFVVSKAGDWTTKTINTPPKKLWTRGFPVHGPLYGARLFRKVVIVATGSGIGPCLSMFADDKVPRRVLWSTRDPEKTYGSGVTNSVLKADPEAIIWNTSEKGYPDILKETYKLYVESAAEAVYVISNPKVTNLIRFGLESRGIAVFGPIFDS